VEPGRFATDDLLEHLNSISNEPLKFSTKPWAPSERRNTPQKDGIGKTDKGLFQNETQYLFPTAPVRALENASTYSVDTCPTYLYSSIS
jgi:hypothetical protein